MSILSSLLCFCLISPAVAFDPPAVDTSAETLDRLSRSAAQELDQSVKDLNALREQIAAEKLPLAQELTAIEEQLTQLRKEHDRIVRLVDAGSLGINNIKSEMKARQDELSYISGLLDEYARTFETKLNVSELQFCGQAIDAAKRAGEDTTLSMTDKFTRQTDLLKLSMQRAIDSIGGHRFPGIGVDMQGSVTQGQFATIGPVALFRSDSGAAGLVVSQTGSTKPLIRPLEGKMQAGIADVVNKGEGLLPLDPSRGGALKALIQRTNLIHIFEKGGPIMWPLLVASILALGTVLERILFLMREKWRRNAKALDRFFTAVRNGDIKQAIEISTKTKFFVVRALGYALAHKETSFESAILYAQAQELKRFRRGVSILDTVITLAPLLGLLGTVTGMMGSFSLIGGDLGSPGAITGGIAEALIATAFGLGIAITALLPFNFLNTKIEVARHEMESAATQLELLVQAHEQRAAAEQAVRQAVGAGVGGVQISTFAPPVVPDPQAQRCQIEIEQRRGDIQKQIADLQRQLEGDSGRELQTAASAKESH